jgi:peroxiredoxin
MDNNDNSSQNRRWPILAVFLVIIAVVGYIIYARSGDNQDASVVSVPGKVYQAVPFDAAKEYKLADIIAAQTKLYNRTWDAVESQLYVRKAPDFVVKGLDGSDIKLSDFTGKEVVLVFWATWCKYCVEEIPSLNVLQKDMGDEVKILAVSDEPDSTVKDFIDGRKIGYTVAIASAGFESMGTIYPIPTSNGSRRPAAMHIGKDGVVKIVYIGSPSLTELKQIVKSK